LGYLINVFAFGDLSSSIGITLGFFLNLFGTGFIAIFLVRRITPIIAKTMPSGKTSGTGYDLVGKQATVSTLLGPGEVGNVVIDTGKGEINVRAKLIGYEGPVLRFGDKVILFSYDDETEIYSCSAIKPDDF
jgi:hypothetical protein